MNTAKLPLVFDGSAVKGGQIDVHDLAPTLLAMGKLVVAANSEINDDDTKIAVTVDATSKGSFEVILNLTQHISSNVIEMLDLSLKSRDRIATARDISELLYAAGGVGLGLLGLLLKLKGKKPDKIEQKDSHVHIHTGPTIIKADNLIMQLYDNQDVRQHASNLVSSFSNSGIETLKISRPSKEDLEIHRDERHYFDSEVETDEEESSEEAVFEATVQIIKLSFKKHDNWNVKMNGKEMSVKIEDDVFLNQIAQNNLSFTKGDQLHCRVRKTETSKSGKIKGEHAIIKVLKFLPAQQLKLDI